MFFVLAEGDCASDEETSDEEEGSESAAARSVQWYDSKRHTMLLRGVDLPGAPPRARFAND